MTPAEVEALSDTTWQAMVDRMVAEAQAIEKANRENQKIRA